MLRGTGKLSLYWRNLLNVTNMAIQERRRQALPRGWSSVFSDYVARAENAEVWDVEGKRFIDFTSGIAVLNTGHLHPAVTSAARSQLERFSHTCFMVSPYESAVTLAERLNSLVPGSTAKKTLFVNSGAEAIENAVKIARLHTGRPGVIAFSGGFHGRTMLALALTGKISPYKRSFGPFPADIYHAPYPYPYRDVGIDDSMDALERLLREDIEPERVAAIVVEPILGEGGFIPAPMAWLQQLREFCNRYCILMIVDEIQTGFARTGTFFAHGPSGIEADLVTMGKGIAGGFPLAAVTGKAEIMDSPPPGSLGGTYGGSPVACSAALAVLDVIENEDLAGRARSIGALMLGRLSSFRQRYDVVGEVRGRGAMLAIELVDDRAGKQPAVELTRTLVSLSADRGLLILSCGMLGNVIRLLPPLTVDDAVISEGLSILEGCLDALAA